jgi:hypothetical protein
VYKFSINLIYGMLSKEPGYGTWPATFYDLENESVKGLREFEECVAVCNIC